MHREDREDCVVVHNVMQSSRNQLEESDVNKCEASVREKSFVPSPSALLFPPPASPLLSALINSVKKKSVYDEGWGTICLHNH
ncbi:hypothetical protein F2P81_011569 [Scophthalmus maximus]|uniref:Uncharacterized protein n=1 Tax=Scophthalmus maximus TaxID=52904 RepID=A0A6A4SS65_SCOMX|nr:hypothetical protein F2P81_011569 [Scophthalmus maximus]